MRQVTTTITYEGFLWRQPQNPYQGTPLSKAELDQLRADVSNVLKDEDCAKFMSALFNQLSTDTGRAAYSSNAMDVFRAVEQQGGFGRRVGPFSAEGGSTVGNGNAFININFVPSDNPFSSAANGRVILHELTHVGSSSSGNYSHYEMARAAYEVALAQGYKDLGTKPSDGDPGGVDASNSVFFSNMQFKACHVK